MIIVVIAKEEKTIVVSLGQIEATLRAQSCHLRFPKDALTAENILLIIQAIVQQAEIHGFIFELPLTRKMHQIIRNGSYLQRIKYIQLVGMRDDIWRQEQFKDAVDFYNFQKILTKNNIINYFATDFKTKRIIAVHPLYVEYDQEIREGLKVMQYKHSEDYPVFVESQNALKAALNDCLPGATLVIDGHWVHNKQSRHGVWDAADADKIAQNIADLVNVVPGKIAHINLLGCESGMVKPILAGLVAYPQLFFKYSQKPDLALRYMGSQRNRALYASTNGESVFAEDSLAFKLLSKLSDTTIAVTATPKLLYPWPPSEPIINIGSDTENWQDEVQAWESVNNPDQLCSLLGCVKSITQINLAQINSHRKRPWA